MSNVPRRRLTSTHEHFLQVTTGEIVERIRTNHAEFYKQNMENLERIVSSGKVGGVGLVS